jgi:hypothetical protein
VPSESDHPHTATQSMARAMGSGKIGRDERELARIENSLDGGVGTLGRALHRPTPEYKFLATFDR